MRYILCGAAYYLWLYCLPVGTRLANALLPYVGEFAYWDEMHRPACDGDFLDTDDIPF